ncbi:hypothetical protein J3R82DRAFT_11756 [Butyriboletus roseoflavus]|nr:hypothetical protein J3R82DRAFT_11756 [Butyriboletus roseoflavus]
MEGKDQAGGRRASDDDEDNVDFETLIAQELAAIKRPRTENRFGRPPIDPVKLIVTHAENVRRTGVTRTKYGYPCPNDHLITPLTLSRYTHRLIPVSGSCVANLPEIHSLCRRVFASFFAEAQGSAETPQVHKVSSQPAFRWPRSHKEFVGQYKIDLRVRNHNTLTRMSVIEEIAKCMPENYVVDLDNPDVFVLVEVFKVCRATILSRDNNNSRRWLQNVCGVSILRDYYKLHKFNVMTLANEKNAAENFKREAGRVQGKESDEVDPTYVAST